MHHSRHRLTVSVAYVTTLKYTRQPMTNELALFAHKSFRQKLNRVAVSSVGVLADLKVEGQSHKISMRYPAIHCVPKKHPLHF